MAFTPDQPFPKSPGDPIRSADWNALVNDTLRLDTEALRLDAAKVNRAGDAITGQLTVAGALGVRTTVPRAPLHVVGQGLVSDGDGFAVPAGHMASGSLTIGSITSSFGGGTSWNANTAGLLMETASDTEIAVHHSGVRVAGLIQYLGASNSLVIGRDMGWGSIGAVGIGVPAPAFKLDVADRIRLRQGSATSSAGLWLFQTTPSADRAFVGMNGDNMVGLMGNAGAGWGLNMDVTSGNMGIRTSPSTTSALTVNGDVSVIGKVRDQKLRMPISFSNPVTTTNAAFTDLLAQTFTLGTTTSGWLLISAQIDGVMGYSLLAQLPQAGGSVEFQLTLDGNVIDAASEVFTLLQTRKVTMRTTLASVSAGIHFVSIRWRASGTATIFTTPAADASDANTIRSLVVIEL